MKVVYVIPHLDAEESEHFAHIPRLLSALGQRLDLLALVERGSPPAHLPGVRRVIPLAGRARFLRTVAAVRQCAHDGYRTYFLRYSRFLVMVLILTYPLFRHRIFMWRSGTADLIEPGVRRTLRRRLRARLDDALNYALARLVHGFVTGPETMTHVMRARWRVPPERMRLLYNDIDGDRFAPLSSARRAAVRRRLGWGGERDEFVVLFVHRLSFRRGTRLLAPFLSGARAAVPRGVRLVVVGDGPDRDSLTGRPGMELLGAVPNRDLPDLYGAADCFLMPSYEEGFPRVLLEAMSAGLPIVTTNAGGSADVVGPGYPHVCDVGDLDALVRHAAVVAALPERERAALGASLRERALAEFSPWRVARMLEEILRESAT